MMNKKGYLIRDFVVAGVFTMGIIGLLVLAVQSGATNYDNPDLVDENFAATYDLLENVTAPIETLLDQTTSGDGLSFKGAFDVAFGAAFSAIQIVFGTLSLLSNIFSNVLVDFGIPKQVGSILFTVGFVTITATMIFTWLSSISRGRI